MNITKLQHWKNLSPYYNKESIDTNFYNKQNIDEIINQIYLPIKIGKCTELGYAISVGGPQFTWIDPDNVQLNNAIIAQWNKTVLVRKENEFPKDHTDGIIMATTSRELENKNYYRNNIFKDTTQEENKTYYYKLFSQTAQGTWNNLVANQFTSSTDLSWGQIQAYVRAGRGPELFPVGTVFEVDHPQYTVNGHGIYFRVVGHDQVPAADESLTHTMCLDMVDGLFTAQYDGVELQYAKTADNTAKVGKHYYLYQNQEYIQKFEGIDWNVGDDISDLYERNEFYIDGIIPNRYEHGSNNAYQSNIMQWLNSDGSSNSWFTPTTIFDICTTTLSSKNGFCKYIDPNFLAVVQNAKLSTASPRCDGIGLKIGYFKFWLPSVTQISGIPIVVDGNSYQQNIQFQYYSSGGDNYKFLMGTDIHVAYMTRSVSGRNNYIIYVTHGENLFYAGTANWGSSTVSACCIIA